MFLANDLDRFGKTTRKRTKEYAPGPGEYSVEKENSKSLVTGAAFVSESKRGWIKADKKPPGPAFYNPAPVPKKKSFHFLHCIAFLIMMPRNREEKNNR